MSECQQCKKQTGDIYKYGVNGVKLKQGLCKECYESSVRNYQRGVYSEPKKAKVVSGGLRGLDVYKEKGQWHAGE
jgi:hypothetical protein